MKEPIDRLANDKDFIMWVRNRLVNLFGDSPECDFIKRLECMSESLAGPVRIPLTDRGQDPEYVRVPRWRFDDLGDYFLLAKDGLEPLRQYRPYETDPELAERKAAINLRRNKAGHKF